MIQDASTAGLLPDQFWGLTVGEVGLVIQGYARRQRNADRVQARGAALLASLQMTKGRACRPQDIMPDFEIE